MQTNCTVFADHCTVFPLTFYGIYSTNFLFDPHTHKPTKLYNISSDEVKMHLSIAVACLSKDLSSTQVFFIDRSSSSGYVNYKGHSKLGLIVFRPPPDHML